HFSTSCVLLHRFSTAETALLTVARLDRDGVLDPNFVTAGRPVPDKSLLIVDESGDPVPQGETGEVEVRSRFLADGYWRDPETTAKSFRPDPDTPGQRTYRTGDLARFLPDGSLQFLGRREHMAKIRGFRVDTCEVETVLLGLDSISAAAVVVRKEQHE